jgi:O-antigen ligase
MKLTRVHHLPISAQASWIGVAAAAIAILISIAIVEQNVLVLAAVTAAALAIVWPVEVSLGVFAVLVPFDQVLVLGNTGTTITWVAGAFAGATLVVYGLVSGRFKSPPRAGLYWGLFVLWNVASTIWAVDPATSLKWLPTVATLFALYIVAVSFRVTRRELSGICLLAIAGGAVAASLIIFQFANHISFEGRASLAAGNLESDPNVLSFSLLLPVSLALGAVLSEGHLLKRTPLMGALALMTISILLAMSRGSLIALCATVLVYLLRVGIRRRILIPVLVLAIPMFFLPDLFYHRLEQASTGRGTGRYDIWLAGLEIVKRYPLLGTGLVNFHVVYPTVAGYTHVFPTRGYAREAHNMYLQVCAETGVIGFAFFTAAIWSQMRAVHRASSRRVSTDHLGIAIEAACWGQLVAGLSGSIQWNKPFWFASILLALISQERPESALNELPLGWGRLNQSA